MTNMASETSEGLLITAKSLKKMYGPHLALDDVNLDIPHGAVGILGPNGAGKSTFFKCLLGLDKDNLWRGKGIGARYQD